ncbi:MAG: hypothetical protein KBT12_07840 [Bacteroidales bacterium]|nr:hypothetical protein [Candidatus Physcousia equi]
MNGIPRASHHEQQVATFLCQYAQHLGLEYERNEGQVAMHFVLEAGYYVQKFPSIEIACIGPRIIEPHSTKERVELSTVDNICKVLAELLKRLA